MKTYTRILIAAIMILLMITFAWAEEEGARSKSFNVKKKHIEISTSVGDI